MIVAAGYRRSWGTETELPTPRAKPGGVNLSLPREPNHEFLCFPFQVPIASTIGGQSGKIRLLTRQTGTFLPQKPLRSSEETGFPKY